MILFLITVYRHTGKILFIWLWWFSSFFPIADLKSSVRVTEYNKYEIKRVVLDVLVSVFAANNIARAC